MASADNERLRAIQEELNGVLEARITDLLGHVRAVQEVTARIASTSSEIQRQEQLRELLDAELSSLDGQSESLRTDNARIEEKVTALRANVQQMRKLRAELMSDLTGLSGEMKGLAGSE